jgi:hypothetical protein
MRILSALLVLMIVWRADGASIGTATTTVDTATSEWQITLHLSGPLANGTWWEVYDVGNFISEYHANDWVFSVDPGIQANARWTYIGLGLPPATTQVFQLSGIGRMGWIPEDRPVTPESNGTVPTNHTPEPGTVTCILGAIMLWTARNLISKHR